MSRVLLFVIGVLLLCVTALGALWLAGQVLVVLGALLTGAAGVLLRLLWFLALAALAGGLSYFIAAAWRPGQTPAAVTGLPQAGPTWPAAPAQKTSRWRRGKGAASPTPAPAQAAPVPEPAAPDSESASSGSAPVSNTVVVSAEPQLQVESSVKTGELQTGELQTGEPTRPA